MKNFTKQLQKNDKFIATARGARTIWRVGTIVVPAAACGYLMVRYNDIYRNSSRRSYYLARRHDCRACCCLRLPDGSLQ
nr:MAG TPA: hypothetical protein [Caudoviricetes sp.]